MRLGILISVLAVALTGTTRGAVTLPMRIVFKGQDRFEQLIMRAKAENWKALPIGQRTAALGQAMVGTPYRSFTLEVDNRVESPSVNFTGLDCWTFFETALAFARMLDEPQSNRDCVVATSSALSRAMAITPLSGPRHTSVWRYVPRTAPFTSCTRQRRTIMAGW